MDLELIRGDTANYKFQRKTTDGEVITTAPTGLFFTIKHNHITSDIVVQKSYADGDITLDSDGWYHFNLTHNDTANLKYRDYYYDVEVVYTASNRQQVTTIAEGVFTIKEEVTFDV